MSSKQAWQSWFSLVIFMFVFCLIAIMLPAGNINWIVSETGLVQPLSAIGYAVCLCVLAYYTRYKISTYWYALVILAFLCLREFDFDTRFFTGGLFNSRQYFTDRTTLLEKLWSAPIALFLLSSLLWLFIKHGKATLKGVFSFDALAWSYCTALGLAASSVMLDGLSRRLGNMGITLNSDLNLMSVVLEEAVEMFIPAFILLALILSIKMSDRLNMGDNRQTM